jgi:hypothetical protein
VSRQPARVDTLSGIGRSDRSGGRSEQVAGQADEIFQPHRLEAQFGAKLPQFVRDGVVQK